MNVTLSIPDADRFDKVMLAARDHQLALGGAFLMFGIDESRVGLLRALPGRALPGVGSVEAERHDEMPKPV